MLDALNFDDSHKSSIARNNVGGSILNKVKSASHKVSGEIVEDPFEERGDAFSVPINV